MKTLTAAALLMLGATLPAWAQDWKQDYRIVRIGVTSAENEADRMARWEPYRDYLEKSLGVEVEIFTAGSYDGVIQALAADQIEFASLGSSAYAAAWTETEGGVRPILAQQDLDGSSGYFSVIAVRCDAGYKTVADLKGKVMAFADPDSTSGYAVPLFNLVRQGIEPTSYFAATPFSGSHEAGVQGVVNHQFDAAATYINNEENGIPQRMVQKGMIKEGEVCFVWQSPEITNGPVTVRANLPPAMIDAVKQAYLRAPVDAPDAFRAITGGDKSTARGFIEVDHDRYQWIVDMRAWMKAQRRG
ncbi:MULTISPECIES: phosphate/phosphite/phosphonate ABC transporter substrate-binding protein [unclassified Haematobacter]|uniref:phosphate/phosphite/phosphonate ABC transporter substrate-binding protein n=1 Tax=unclassified Haematobacter TaxID=2640585 RepID=UPI0025BC6651|nr:MULTISPECIES: phosphate/phosphite/phosphonate ABC transporter substrate-binding protein [unclassified Haematobacter]